MKKYNNEKIVFGKELGEYLINLGFIPVCVNENRNNPNELVYHFPNSYLIRNIIRKKLNK